MAFNYKGFDLLSELDLFLCRYGSNWPSRSSPTLSSCGRRSSSTPTSWCSRRPCRSSSSSCSAWWSGNSSCSTWWGRSSSCSTWRCGTSSGCSSWRGRSSSASAPGSRRCSGSSRSAGWGSGSRICRSHLVLGQLRRFALQHFHYLILVGDGSENWYLIGHCASSLLQLRFEERLLS